MTRKTRYANPAHKRVMADAIQLLREARVLLRVADAPRTLRRVQLAISSAKAAQRHIRTRIMRTDRRREEYGRLFAGEDRGADLFASPVPVQKKGSRA